MTGAVRRREGASSESGFTLVEAMIAIGVLVVGLVGVTNLMLVSAGSNKLAHAGTGAATQATEVLERLKAVPFNSLVAGGNLSNDQGTMIGCDEASQDCAVASNYNALRDIPGVGRIKTRWTIATIDAQTLFITVRAQSLGTLMARQTRAEFTTFRSCTSSALGCPF